MRTLCFALLLAAAPALAQSVPEADPDTASGAGTVRGVVTDVETGLPIMGAGVVLTDLGIGAVSDRQGRFEIAGVPPGAHPVRAGAYLYHLVNAEAEVADDAPARLDVALRPGAGPGCAAVHEHGEDGSHMTPAEDS